MRAELKAPRFTVYRIFDGVGDLLYVGQSNNIVGRLSTHARRPWGQEIRTVTITWYSSEDEAHVAEAHAITTEGPRYNIDGVIGANKMAHGGRQAMVLRAIDDLGEATVREIEAYLGDGLTRSYVGCSVTRLLSKGSIRVAGTRLAVSGPHPVARVFALAGAA